MYLSLELDPYKVQILDHYVSSKCEGYFHGDESNDVEEGN